MWSIDLRNTGSKDQQQHSKSAVAGFLALVLPLTFHKALGRSVSHPLPSPSPSCKAKLKYLHTWLEQKEGEDKIWVGNIYNGDLKIQVLWNTRRPFINVQNGPGAHRICSLPNCKCGQWSNCSNHWSKEQNPAVLAPNPHPFNKAHFQLNQ